MANRRKRNWLWLAAGLGALAVLIVVIVAIGVGAAQGGAVATEEQEVPSNMASDLADYSEDDASGETADGAEGADGAMGDQAIDEYVPDEVLVSVEDPSALDELKPGDKIGDVTIKSVEIISDGSDGTTVAKLTIEGDAPMDDTLKALNELEGVAAQKNFIYRIM